MCITKLIHCFTYSIFFIKPLENLMQVNITNLLMLVFFQLWSVTPVFILFPGLQKHETRQRSEHLFLKVLGKY